MPEEYGGYLPIELPFGSEYYQGPGVERLNCGRSAIYRALEDSHAKGIWLPYYICKTVFEPVDRIGVTKKFYNIDKTYRPIDVTLAEGEWLLWVNYFGVVQPNIIRDVVSEFERVIVDNTQAFFVEPIRNVYNIYSCRKFIGVTDGAYLIKDDLIQKPLQEDRSSNRANYALRCIEEGTNAAYLGHLSNEGVLAQDILAMSPLTKRILSSVNYEILRQKRAENYKTLHSYLGEVNRLDLPGEADAIAYPLLMVSSGLRKYLIDNKIYIPQWWKVVLGYPNANNWEKMLSQYLLPLPIDQRYCSDDMKFIAGMILEYLHREEAHAA